MLFVQFLRSFWKSTFERHLFHFHPNAPRAVAALFSSLFLKNTSYQVCLTSK